MKNDGRITYSANQQTGKISYMDNGKEVGTTPLTGNTDGDVTITPKAPAGYDIAPNQNIPTSEKATATGIPTVTVNVIHHQSTVKPGDLPKPGDKKKGNSDKKPGDGTSKTDISYEDLHKAITRTINIKDPHTGLKTTTATINSERTATIDDVTGDVTYDNWTLANGSKSGFDAFTIPDVPCYTSEITKGSADDLKALTPSQDQINNWQDPSVEIDYTANMQSGQINYVDGQGKTIKTDTITGKTDQTISVTPSVPAGWVIDGSYPKTVKATADGVPTVTIKVTHHQITVNPGELKPGEKKPGNHNKKLRDGTPKKDVSYENLHKTITRTINVTTPQGTVKTIKQEAHLTRTATIDDVTGDVQFGDWSTVSWAAFTPDAIDGYAFETLTQKTVDGTTKDETDNMTYTAEAQSGVIVYVDSTGRTIGTTPLAGKTGESVQIKPVASAGWKLVAGQDLPTAVTAGPKGIPTVTVKVEHAEITVDPAHPKTPADVLPDNPQKHYPAGVAEADLNKDVTRTITVTEPDGTVIRKVQTVHLTRSATFDEASGAVAYGPWSTGHWDAYAVPAVAGYTPSQTAVAAEEVNAEMPSEQIDITYTLNPQDHGHNGQSTTNTNHDAVNNGQQSSAVTNEAQLAKNAGELHAAVAQTSQAQRKLPQTGNDNDQLAVAGLGLLSILGLYGFRKRQD